MTKINLFASGVIAVTFCFWSVLYFFMAFLMMLFAFFYSHKHPLVFFVNASAKQRFSRQNSHTLTD